MIISLGGTTLYSRGLVWVISINPFLSNAFRVLYIFDRGISEDLAISSALPVIKLHIPIYALASYRVNPNFSKDSIIFSILIPLENDFKDLD